MQKWWDEIKVYLTLFILYCKFYVSKSLPLLNLHVLQDFTVLFCDLMCFILSFSKENVNPQLRYTISVLECFQGTVESHILNRPLD